MTATGISSGHAPTSDPAVRSPWLWFTGIGLCIALMGAIVSADLLLATLAATFALGVLMIFAAILQLAHAFTVRRWRGTLLWTLSAPLYLLAGISVLADPIFAAALLTLFLAITLAVSGALRCWLAWSWPGRKAWLLASGLVSLAAAVAVGLGWPLNSAWVLGLVLSVDLLVQGFMLMPIGLSLRPR